MEAHTKAGWIAALGAAGALYYGSNIPADMDTFESDVLTAARSYGSDAVGDAWDKLTGSEDEGEQTTEPEWKRAGKIALGIETPFVLIPEDTWRDVSRTAGLTALTLVSGTYWLARKPRRQ